jgi:hypothetical protein
VALWAVAVVGLLVALAALMHARRLARRLETLNQSYWELRYDYTRLRSRVARLDPDAADEPDAAETASPSPQGPAAVAFVPLASLKKKGQ